MKLASPTLQLSSLQIPVDLFIRSGQCVIAAAAVQTDVYVDGTREHGGVTAAAVHIEFRDTAECPCRCRIQSHLQRHTRQMSCSLTDSEPIDAEPVAVTVRTPRLSGHKTACKRRVRRDDVNVIRSGAGVQSVREPVGPAKLNSLAPLLKVR